MFTHTVLRSVALAAVLIGLAGCGSSQSPGASGLDGGAGVATEKRFYDRVITAFDGETIGMTVYEPALPARRNAPLILHGHGFGLSRARNLDNPDPVEAFIHGDLSAEAARRLWNDGYYVISFDQRGFGESSGNVTIMSPDTDIRNVQDILDWAQANLPRLAYEAPGDPLLGAVGLSYGGMFQTVGAAMDPRFDAISPQAMPYDLEYSLYPNQVVKSIWVDLLVLLGAPTSQFRFEPFLYEAFLLSQFGIVQQSLIDTLKPNASVLFCEGGHPSGRGVPDVDAFFVQGAGDVLFNMNESARNLACFKNAGNDARLLVQSEGHIIPALQEAGPIIAFGGDPLVRCGERTYDTAQMMVDFLDEKLRAGGGSESPPDLCIARGDQRGITPRALPTGGVPLMLPTSTVLQGAVGYVTTLLQNLPLATLLDVLAALPAELATALEAVLGGLADPATLTDSLDEIINLLPSDLVYDLTAPAQFTPLLNVDAPGMLAGIPLAELSVEGPTDGLFFLGLGIRRDGRVFAVNDQVIPVRGSGNLSIEMVGVNEQIEIGDEVGLMLYGFHPYYLNDSLLALAPLPISVSGSLSLPVSAN